MMGRASLAAAVFLVACGAAPPAEPVTATPEEATPTSDAPSEPSEAQADDPPPGAGDEAQVEGTSASGNATLSEAELQLVMQQVLDDPDLDRYFHLTKQGRLPLKIHAPDLPEKLKLTKGGHDVKFVDKPSSKKEAVLVFTRIERDGDSARLRYEYDVEGIRGSAVVYLKGGKWRLGANRVIEK
ncbi:MAG TPA: hypothetical protein PKA88_21665 [Polyangiaceae bacterium]|nr:hypothetical protein [Polyangiaceae bacterium]HMR73849.1 hypothetical protein [Polyangiaceae bacterium]